LSQPSHSSSLSSLSPLWQNWQFCIATSTESHYCVQKVIPEEMVIRNVSIVISSNLVTSNISNPFLSQYSVMKHSLLLNITMNDNDQERMAFSHYEFKNLRNFIFRFSLHNVYEINAQCQKTSVNPLSTCFSPKTTLWI